MTKILVNNESGTSANGISEVFDATGSPVILFVRADDFGGASINLQVASRNDPFERYRNLTNGQFTEDSTMKIDYLPSRSFVRVEVVGATASTSNLFVGIG